MEYKYDSLQNNRQQLYDDCQFIKTNINKYKGQLLFLNHDIGTGKTTQVAKIISELALNHRILVLTYSYQVALEWNEMLTRASCGSSTAISENDIYIIMNPANRLSKCENSEIKERNLSMLSIKQIHAKFCKTCKSSKIVTTYAYSISP